MILYMIIKMLSLAVAINITLQISWDSIKFHQDILQHIWLKLGEGAEPYTLVMSSEN